MRRYLKGKKYMIFRLLEENIIVNKIFLKMGQATIFFSENTLVFVSASADVVLAFTAVIGVIYYFIQSRHNRSALHAQTMIALRNLADKHDYNNGMSLLRELNECVYEHPSPEIAYEHPSPEIAYDKWPEEKKKRLRSFVSFLNFAAILSEHNILDRQILWNMYFWAYDLGFSTLIKGGNKDLDSDKETGGWWLDIQRSDSGYDSRFSNFERMCWAVAAKCDYDRSLKRKTRELRTRQYKNELIRCSGRDCDDHSGKRLCVSDNPLRKVFGKFLCVFIKGFDHIRDVVKKMINMIRRCFKFDTHRVRKKDR